VNKEALLSSNLPMSPDDFRTYVKERCKELTVMLQRRSFLHHVFRDWVLDILLSLSCPYNLSLTLSLNFPPQQGNVLCASVLKHPKNNMHEKIRVLYSNFLWYSRKIY